MRVFTFLEMFFLVFLLCFLTPPSEAGNQNETCYNQELVNSNNNFLFTSKSLQASGRQGQPFTE